MLQGNDISTWYKNGYDYAWLLILFTFSALPNAPLGECHRLAFFSLGSTEFPSSPWKKRAPEKIRLSQFRDSVWHLTTFPNLPSIWPLFHLEIETQSAACSWQTQLSLQPATSHPNKNPLNSTDLELQASLGRKEKNLCVHLPCESPSNYAPWIFHCIWIEAWNFQLMDKRHPACRDYHIIQSCGLCTSHRIAKSSKKNTNTSPGRC